MFLLVFNFRFRIQVIETFYQCVCDYINITNDPRALKDLSRSKIQKVVSEPRESLCDTKNISFYTLTTKTMHGTDDGSEVTQNQNTTSLQQLTLTNSNAKFPYLKKEEYELWAMKMQNWITNIDWNIWEVFRKGNSLKKHIKDADGVVTIIGPKTVEEILAVQRENKVRTILLQAIPDDHMGDFHYMEDAKDIWMAMMSQRG